MILKTRGSMRYLDKERHWWRWLLAGCPHAKRHRGDTGSPPVRDASTLATRRISADGRTRHDSSVTFPLYLLTSKTRRA